MRRQWINGLRIELRIISIISLEIMGTKFQKYYNFILKLSYERHVLLSVGWLVSRWGQGSVAVLLEHLMTSCELKLLNEQTDGHKNISWRTNRGICGNRLAPKSMKGQSR